MTASARFRALVAALAAFVVLAQPQARAAEQAPLPPASAEPLPASSSTTFSAPEVAAGSQSSTAAQASTAPAKPEHPAKRFENVFFISLPFTALYSAILTIGAAFAIEVGIRKGSLRITIPYQAAAVGLACGSSAWIAWRDHSSPSPEVSAPPSTFNAPQPQQPPVR